MNESDARIDSKRLKKLFLRLLEIYSPSGKEEQVSDYLHGYLHRLGLPVVRQQVEDKRCNLVVSPGGEESAAAFIGHVDTIAAHDLEDFGPSEEEGEIFGLGAADMKGGCAALVEAFVCLWEAGYTEAPLCLALVVGEEEEGDGAAELVKDYQFPWALIAEPTDLKPCLSHYGYVEVNLHSKGQRRHASLAKGGPNAVDDLLRVLLRLTKYLHAERPEAVYNIRDLYSSGSGFVVPEECRAWLDLHLPPQSPIAEITLEMEEIVSRELAKKPGMNVSLQFDTVEAGYALPEKGPLIGALRQVWQDRRLAWEPMPFPSHSDANQLWAAGVWPILLGCGQLQKAHMPEESVEFAQVLTAAEIYLDLALRLCQS